MKRFKYLYELCTSSDLMVNIFSKERIRHTSLVFSRSYRFLVVACCKSASDFAASRWRQRKISSIKHSLHADVYTFSFHFSGVKVIKQRTSARRLYSALCVNFSSWILNLVPKKPIYFNDNPVSIFLSTVRPISV